MPATLNKRLISSGKKIFRRVLNSQRLSSNLIQNYSREAGKKLVTKRKNKKVKSWLDEALEDPEGSFEGFAEWNKCQARCPICNGQCGGAKGHPGDHQCPDGYVNPHKQRVPGWRYFAGEDLEGLDNRWEGLTEPTGKWEGFTNG